MKNNLGGILKFITIVVLFIYNTLYLFSQEKKPNIVLIMADDLGYECIQVNGGNSYNTPNIDRLASQGIRFEYCFSQPLCTPSRVQLMTGKYNVKNYFSFGELDRTQTTFGNILKSAGYKTAIAGKWQLGKEKDSPQHFGFDESLLWQQSLPRTDEEGHDTRFSNPILQLNGEIKKYTNGEYAPDLVSDFLCDFIEKNREEPFFVYYPMILTHCPFAPTPDSDEWDSNSKGSLTYKGEPEYFPDMVSYMDKLVGKVVSKIDELGLGENTLVIFTGDNGTDQPIVSILNGKEYPGGKGLTTDNGIRVPLIARYVGEIEAGSLCSDLVDFSDFLPTMCELTDVEILPDLDLDGQSFLPQLFGNKGNSREWIYSWYSRSGKTDELKEFARNHDFKLYKTGELYKVKDDFFEKSPLNLGKLNDHELESYKSLKGALNTFQHVREKE